MSNPMPHQNKRPKIGLLSADEAKTKMPNITKMGRGLPGGSRSALAQRCIHMASPNPGERLHRHPHWLGEAAP